MRIDFNGVKLIHRTFEETERFKTTTHCSSKSLEQKAKYNVHIFEMEGWGGRGVGVIDNENGRYRETKLIQQIIITYLTNYSSFVLLSLSLFPFSISLSFMYMSL